MHQNDIFVATIKRSRAPVDAPKRDRVSSRTTIDRQPREQLFLQRNHFLIKIMLRNLGKRVMLRRVFTGWITSVVGVGHHA
jgi:hypothetical protein